MKTELQAFIEFFLVLLNKNPSNKKWLEQKRQALTELTNNLANFAFFVKEIQTKCAEDEEKAIGGFFAIFKLHQELLKFFNYRR